MDFENELRRQGVSEATIDEIRRGYLRQSDYTQKRQSESADVQELKRQVAFLQGQQQAMQPAQQSAVDQFLSELGEGEQNEHVRTLLSRHAAAVKQDLESRLAPALATAQRAAHQAVYSQQLDDYYQTKLVPLFGEGVKEYWPSLKERSLGMLLEGQSVVPETLLLNEHRDEATKLLRENAVQSKKEQAERVSEGFEQPRYTAPAMSGSAPAGPARGNNGQQGPGLRGARPVIDVEAVARQALADATGR